MNREFLKGLGLEAEAIDKIMAENGKDIEKAKGNAESNASKVTELTAEVDKLKETVKERDEQLDTLKKSAGDNAQLKEQIEQLTADNKAAAEKHTKEMDAIRKSHAIESALAKANAKDSEVVRKLIDESKVSLDNGNLIGLNEQIDALKEGDVTKALFSEGKPKLKGTEPGHGSDPDDGEDDIFAQRIAKYRKK